MKYIMAIDFGTSAIKTAVFNESGEIKISKTSEYSLIYGDKGIIEISLEELQRAFDESFLGCITSNEFDVNELISIGFSSSGETMLFIDKNGNPTRNGITWMDTRASVEADELIHFFGNLEAYKITGQANIDVFNPAPKIYWLKKYENDVLKNTDKIMFMKDYFIYMMTGNFICDDSVLCTSSFWNVNNRSYWNEMLNEIGITVKQLPKIVNQGSIVGTLNDKFALKYGLSKNILVNAGAQDQVCGALGAGNIKAGILSESLGSAMMVMATLDNFVINKKNPISCSPAAINGKYVVNAYSTGAIAMRWFRDNFCIEEKKLSEERNVSSFQIIDNFVRQIPIGSDGLIMLPYLQGTGMPKPNDNSKGVYFGITTRHNKYYFARSLMEGVSMSLRYIIEGINERLGLEVKEIICFSGGSKSKTWMQIQADVTGIPIKVTKNSENTACFGAAILAGIACRVWINIEEAVSKIEVSEIYFPNIENNHMYDLIYDKFIQIRDSLDDLF